MNKTNIQRTLGVLLLVFILYKIPQYVRLPFGHISAIEAIPTASPLFFQTTVDDLSNTSHPLEDWSVLQKIPRDLDKLQALLKPSISSIKDTKIAAALMQSNAFDIDVLYILDGLPDALTAKNGVKIRQYNFQNETVYEATFDDKSKLSYATYRNLLIVAPYSLMVEDALSQLQNVRSNLCNNSAFRKVFYKKNPPKTFNAYINFEQLAIFLKPYVKKTYQASVNNLSHIFKWAGFQFGQAAVVYTIDGKLSASKQNELFAMIKNLNKAPLPIALYDVLPNNVALLQALNTFEAKTLSQNELFTKYFAPWVGAHAAYVLTEPYSQSIQDEQFVVLQSTDMELSKHYLDKYAAEVGTLENTTYNGFTIKRLISEAFDGNVFGSNFNPIKNPYYTDIDGYLVFCNALGPLQVWIDKYVVGQTLSKEEAFLLLQNESNNHDATGKYLLESSQMINVLKAFLKESLDPNMASFIQELPKIGMVQFNFTPKSKHYQLKGGINNNTQATLTNLIWKTPLAAKASSAPNLVHLQDQLGFIIQDETNTLYLIDQGGKIKWTRALSAPLLSKITEIDYYRNGENYFLFNTKKYIYLLDKNGKNAPSFPIKLQSNATNGMLVVDFNKEGKHDFFVACENRNIYGFDQRGRPLPGWNPNFNKGIIKQPLKHFQYGNKDFIVSLNTKGKLQVFRQNGEKRFNSLYFKEKFLSDIDIENSELLTRIVATDQKGNIQVVNSSGKNFKLPSKVGDNHQVRFCYADLVGDGRKDYILLDDNELVTYFYEEKSYEEAYRYVFNYTQDDLFSVPFAGREKLFIGTVCKAKKQINLLTPEGSLHPDFPLAGTTPFIIVHLFGKEDNTLVVAHDSGVYAYQL